MKPLTIPPGFKRVTEITQNPGERQAIYDELKTHRMPVIKSGGGKHGTVHVSEDHALDFIRRRKARLDAETAIRSTPKHAPVIVPNQPSKDYIDVFCEVVKTFTKNQEFTGSKIDETNRLLGELLKIWGGVK